MPHLQLPRHIKTTVRVLRWDILLCGHARANDNLYLSAAPLCVVTCRAMLKLEQIHIHFGSSIHAETVTSSVASKLAQFAVVDSECLQKNTEARDLM